MAIVNIERLKAWGTYLGHFEGLGYLYQIDNKMYTFNRDGIKAL